MILGAQSGVVDPPGSQLYAVSGRAVLHFPLVRRTGLLESEAARTVIEAHAQWLGSSVWVEH